MPHECYHVVAPWPHEEIVKAAQTKGCDLTGSTVTQAGRAAAHRLWQALKTVGESRSRREMSLLARRSAITRPELAASLRSAARQSWAQ